jgi:hypothetical protein
MADPSDTTEWTQNDTWPPLRLQLSDENGVITTLEDAELVRFIAKPETGASIIGTAIAIVGGQDNDGYNLTYTWGATDLSVPGEYQIEVEVTWDTDGDPDQVESWGSSQGDLPTLVVRPELG